MATLEIQQIKKAFGTVVAIRQASFSVASGEIRAILGGNGSGKSTLAKILTGIVKEDAGHILLNGSDYRVHSPSEAKQKRVILTSQELSLMGNLDVKTNIMLCDPPRRGPLTDKRALAREARGILKELNLEHIADKKVETLPPDQKYLVEFAKALVQQPDVLICDEITSALYREEVELIRQKLYELKEKGCAVLFISHRMHEISSICDSITIMKNGEVVGTFGVHARSHGELVAMMTGRDQAEDACQACNPDAFPFDRPLLLRAEDIPIFSYHTRLNLDIYAGDVIGIAGLQGHGQSDLVRALYALSGARKVVLGGRQRLLKGPVASVHAGLAFVSGDREGEGVFQTRSVGENLNVVRRLLRKNPRSKEQAILSENGVVYGSVDHLITSLSGGNQQKVVLSRWLCAHPKLLIADDPTKGIDVQARSDLHQSLISLTREGAAVVMVSSDDDELVQLSRQSPYAKILVMYEGQIVKVLTGAEITEANILAAAIPSRKEGRDAR